MAEDADGSIPAYRYRFNDVIFDESRFELRVADHTVDAQPKTLEVLLVLLRAVGEIVTTEELVEAVWPERADDASAPDNIVNVQIRKLRSALGVQNAERITTLARKGYRFDGALERQFAGRRFTGELALAVGMPMPRRENFILEQLLGRSKHNEVWRARHAKFDTTYVYKCTADGNGLDALKHELTLSRVLQKSLGERPDLVRITECDFKEPPFFLELEDGGQNLVQWDAEGKRLQAMSLPQRIDLFLQIADAVAAAHRVGVLHKDLKPSNILVSPKPDRWQIKVNDFGSGRLLDPERLEELGITRIGLTLSQGFGADGAAGTAFYLAPELFKGQQPTIQSDVYALGLLLYKIVIADLSKPWAPGWERDVDDEELRKDIAAATDGDPAHRIESAATLASRLRSLDQRHEQARQEVEQARQKRLEAENIKAAQEAALEARRKLELVQTRQKGLIAAAVLLLVFLSASLWLYHRADMARQRAEQETKRSKAMSDFLTLSFLGNTGELESGSDSAPTIHGALMRAAESVTSRFSDDPLSEGTIHLAIGEGLFGLDDHVEGLKQEQLAISLFEKSLGPDNTKTLDAMYTLAGHLLEQSLFSETKTLLDTADQRLGREAGRPLNLMVRATGTRGFLQYQLSDCEAALATFRRTEQLREQDLKADEDYFDLINMRIWVGTSLICLGRYDEARQYFATLSNTRISGKDIDPSLMASLRLQYGQALGFSGDPKAAEQQSELGLKSMQDMLGPDNFYLADGKNGVANLYVQLGFTDRARDYATQAYATFRKKPGEKSIYALRALRTLGVIDFASGNLPQAIERLSAARSGLIGIVGTAGPDAQAASYWLAMALSSTDRISEASGLVVNLNPAVLLGGLGGRAWDTQLKALRGAIALRAAPTPENRAQLLAAIEDLEKAGVPAYVLSSFKQAIAAHALHQ